MVNKGVAFGMLEGLPWWIGLLTIGCLLYCAVKTRELWERVGIVLVVAGGVMNLIQRYSQGMVSDPWKVFNLGYNNFADYLIFFGVVVYGYTYYRKSRKS